MLTPGQFAQPAANRLLPMIPLQREFSGKLFYEAVSLFRQRGQAVRHRGLGFLFTDELQGNIQLRGAYSWPYDYVADPQGGFIVGGQHPNGIAIMDGAVVLPGGEY